MLSAISWQEYLAVALITSAVYYFVILLLYYRQEIFTIVSAPTTAKPAADLPAIMGRVEQPVDPEVCLPVQDGQEHAITPARQTHPVEEPAAQQPQEVPLLVSTVDLVSEFKTLIEMIAEYGSSKSDGMAFIRALLQKHRHLAQSTFREPVTAYILEMGKTHFEFTITRQELNACWDSQQFKQQNT